MSNAVLLEAFSRLGQSRLLVLGDVILDRYTWGSAQQVSHDAPVIQLREEQREERLGGAANVCNMLRGLEAEVCLASVVGDDEEGRDVRRLLSEAGVGDALLIDDASRPTTVKERFIGRAAKGHAHQILRVDHEVRDPLAAHLEQELSVRLCQQISRFDGVLVSDYDKGVCTPALLAKVIPAAKEAGVPVLVDPIRSVDHSRYRGATTMTPNRLEAELATGIRIQTIEQAFAAGRKLCSELGLTWAIITLDRDGMALVHPDGRSQHFPTRPREVYDITGAGDMVLATIGLALAGGLSVEQALQLANIAGGLEVEKVGVVPITRDEIRVDLLRGSRSSHQKVLALEQLAGVAEVHRKQGQRIVFTEGAFDLLNLAHIRLLMSAAAQGEALFVGVRRKAGGAGAVIQAQDRALMLAALGCVDYVTCYDESAPLEILGQLRPHVLVRAKSDRKDAHEVAAESFVRSYGGRVHTLPAFEDLSSSRLADKIAA